MQKTKRNHFYRLFSGRKQLTIQERESIFRNVISAAAQEEKQRESLRWRWPKSATAAAMLALVSLPLAYLLLNTSAPDEFTEKGGEAGPFFVAQCDGPALSKDCRRGDTLIFKLKPPQNAPYFSAFAAHKRTKKTLWYYPSRTEGRSIRVDSEKLKGVLKEGVRIGEEHPIGEYTIYGIFSAEPIRRTQIRTVFKKSPRDPSGALTILETTIEVE